MSRLAQTIGQIFGIEFAQNLPHPLHAGDFLYTNTEQTALQIAGKLSF